MRHHPLRALPAVIAELLHADADSMDEVGLLMLRAVLRTAACLHLQLHGACMEMPNMLPCCALHASAICNRLPGVDQDTERMQAQWCGKWRKLQRVAGAKVSSDRLQQSDQLTSRLPDRKIRGSRRLCCAKMQLGMGSHLDGIVHVGSYSHDQHPTTSSSI